MTWTKKTENDTQVDSKKTLLWPTTKCLKKPIDARVIVHTSAFTTIIPAFLFQKQPITETVMALGGVAIKQTVTSLTERHVRILGGKICLK